MIERLVRGAIAWRGWVLAVTVALAGLGLLMALRLKLDALPDITSNQVVVMSGAPGLTPEEVERQVTRPVELAMGGLPGLVEHRSISRYGISSVTAVFEDEVDPYLARQMVAERLASVAEDLPPGVGPPELGPVTGGLGEVFHFTLSSPSRTAAELYEIAVLRVAPLLRGLPGVVEVNTWGGERRTLEVVADPARLAQREIPLEALREALTRATGSASGASLPAGSGQALLRAVARPRDPSELAQAIVARGSGERGAPVRVADVAEVRVGALPRLGAATADGRGEVVYVMAQMLRGDNALEVMDRIHARLPEVRAALPEDVAFHVVYDRSMLVKSTLRTVGRTLVEGGLLVVAVLFAMLGSLRAGLLVASVIPLSMIGAAAGMVSTGIAGNLMSLGAIDFGLVVDGAVVMVEHVFHAQHEHGAPGASAGVGVGGGGGGGGGVEERRSWMSRVCGEVASPVFYSVLIILLVYVPVLTLTGVDGKMFRPMALTVVFALVTALVLSLTFVPAAASLLLRARDVPARAPLLVRLITWAYEPTLGVASRHPLVVTVSALLLLASGALLFARAGSELTPQLDEGDLVVQTTRAPDISLASAVRDAGRLEAAVGRVPEVLQVVSRVGSPAVATDLMGLEQADVFVAVRPRGEWREGLTRDALIAEIQAAIDEGSPGAEPSFTQPIQMRFNELLGGSVADVTVSVYGEDLGELRRLAEGIAGELGKVQGAADVRIMAPPDVSLVEVRPRALDASQAGLSVGEILDAVRALRQGVHVGETWDGPVRVPIVLRLGGAASAFEVGRVALPTSTGGAAPLDRVATVETIPSPSLVNHQNGERRLVIGFNVRGVDLGELVTRAQAAVGRLGEVPRGYRLVWGGQYETLREATARLTLVLPAVVALILAALYAAFRKVRPTLIIFTNVPFACVGGMIALASRGMPVSMSAAVGFIALSGVAVLNGVVLLSRVIANEAEGHPAGQAALLAARSRARPVLMTALVAALGFIPMMLNTGVGAEVQRPLATVVVGGLATSTLLTLIIVPTLYPWLTLRTLWRWRRRA
ncbi:efflux RND transporter permease subunit [Chondromyces apiculatus]|uniref:Cobalt-zinc-cadmium resistance protein CzcA/ Cation efflux system protein CusA n=1 Tax=Chondromyces apiculatus DSM 436 TaxID=1192034 RepID=A0A017TIV9_9BACT|nr:CusA/CzcA family heavy metal efflux RND transporter [Chondromyces apiculatus]EYF08785.1 Cobalt-zinc-cadmium resistance protein CzcA/ Cation efflux system protein CusA [Chondromyces apiculatus DSM 436]